ncbi:MAG TPA: porin family protein [Flavitalea sp.]|nr:porin family protein [Flavitalea sp.]
MKKIFTLSVFISFLFIFNAEAQTKFGIRAGLSSASWKGDAVQSLNNLVTITNGYVDTRGRTGFFAGGFAAIPVSDMVSIEPGLYYSQKGYALQGNLEVNKLEFLGANARLQVQSHYIDVPLLLKVMPVKGLQLYAGPQVSYLVKNNMHVDAGILGFSLINRNMDITDQFNPFDFAVVGGAGYKFDNGFSITAGYDHGLSRLDKNSNFKSYNRVIKVGVGFEF